jgi:hypothetical protein
MKLNKTAETAECSEKVVKCEDKLTWSLLVDGEQTTGTSSCTTATVTAQDMTESAQEFPG